MADIQRKDAAVGSHGVVPLLHLHGAVPRLGVEEHPPALSLVASLDSNTSWLTGTPPTSHSYRGGGGTPTAPSTRAHAMRTLSARLAIRARAKP